MTEKLVYVAYETLAAYPQITWAESYYMLFQRAYKDGEKELAKQIFYKIVIEAIRTTDSWILEECTTVDTEMLLALEELGLYDHALELLRNISKKMCRKTPRKYLDRQWEFKRYSPKRQFRGKLYDLCACCHDYVLTCDEIQNFPLKYEESYIRATFEHAFTQKELHKKYFLLERLVEEYVAKNPIFSLLFDLWVMAEKAGAHFEPLGFLSQIDEEIFRPAYWNEFRTIINFRHKEHDSMIGDAIALLLKRGKYEMALFLNAKLSSPRVRVFDAVCAALNNEGDEEKEMLFLQRVGEAVKHEILKDED